MKTLITTATLAAAFAVGLAGPAAATRPLDTPAGHRDQCRNIGGVQRPHELVGITARYAFDTSTPRKWDCVYVNTPRTDGTELPYPRLGHCNVVKP